MAEPNTTFDFDFNGRTLAGSVVLVAGGTGGLGSATVCTASSRRCYGIRGVLE
jgi:FlaA1/EpsC-like NDP-sugar epimerase